MQTKEYDSRQNLYRALLVTSRKSQAEMRAATDEELLLLEDSLVALNEIKEDLQDILKAPSPNGVQLQARGKLYQRLLKKRIFKANYQSPRR